ncbi:beta-mannanase [Rhizobium sp. BK512]|nr:beta-mannanase [Rhizobium sp. BK512]
MKTLAKKISTATIAMLLLGVADVSHQSVAQGAATVMNAGAQTITDKTIRDKRPAIHADGIKFGAYDPHGDFGAQQSVTTEHLSFHGKTSILKLCVWRMPMRWRGAATC